MMKLFFGLMDKINRPLHIIDLSFSPLRRKRDVTKPVRWTENEGTTMRAFRKRGRYHKEKECCRRAEEEEEDDDDDEEEEHSFNKNQTNRQTKQNKTKRNKTKQNKTIQFNTIQYNTNKQTNKESFSLLLCLPLCI